MTCEDKKNCLLEKESDPQTIIDQSSPPARFESNIDGERLRVCSKDPLTGYDRSGYCNYLKGDRGLHLVCAVVNEKFLFYTKKRGNDLSSPNLRYGFKGLKPGDRWCLCVSRVIEANKDGIPLKIIRGSTNIESGLR